MKDRNEHFFISKQPVSVTRPDGTVLFERLYFNNTKQWAIRTQKYEFQFGEEPKVREDNAVNQTERTLGVKMSEKGGFFKSFISTFRNIKQAEWYNGLSKGFFKEILLSIGKFTKKEFGVPWFPPFVMKNRETRYTFAFDRDEQGTPCATITNRFGKSWKKSYAEGLDGQEIKMLMRCLSSKKPEQIFLTQGFEEIDFSATRKKPSEQNSTLLETQKFSMELTPKGILKFPFALKGKNHSNLFEDEKYDVAFNVWDANGQTKPQADQIDLFEKGTFFSFNNEENGLCLMFECNKDGALRVDFLGKDKPFGKTYTREEFTESGMAQFESFLKEVGPDVVVQKGQENKAVLMKTQNSQGR